MTQRSSRWPVAQKLTEMTASLPWMRAVMAVCLCVLSLCGVVRANDSLTVHDSLNRYSLYGRVYVKFGDGTSSATGGWVGSDSSIYMMGGNNLRSTVTSGDSIYNSNGDANEIHGRTIVKRFLYSRYNNVFDSGVYVGDSAYVGHGSYLDSGTTGLQIGRGWAGQIKGEQNVVYFANQKYTLQTASAITSPTSIPGVSWYANPPVPYTSFALPDTSIIATSLGDIDLTDWHYQDAFATCKGWYKPTPLLEGSLATGLSVIDTAHCHDSIIKSLGYSTKIGVLKPGNYGTVKIGQGTTLALTEGVYHFDSLYITNGDNQWQSRLVALQPNSNRTVIVVEKGFDGGQPSAAMPTIVAPINYEKGYGTDTNKFAGGTMMIVSHARVNLRNYWQLWATLSAPKDTVYLNEGDKLFGQIFARAIVADNHFKGTDGAFIPYFPHPSVVSFPSGIYADTVIEKDVNVATGKPDTSYINFPVHLNHVSGAVVTVVYHTVDGSAASGANWANDGAHDYVPVTRDSVRISYPDTIGYIKIPVLGDNVYEGTETFQVLLDTVYGGSLDTTFSRKYPVATGVIFDNEAPPTLQVRDTALAEGNITAGKRDTTVFKFAVFLSDTSNWTKAYTTKLGSDVIFSWHTVDSSATIADSDYIAASGTDTIKAGTTTDTIRVKILGDNRYENNESFKVVIDSTSLKLALKSSQMKLVGIGTIKNDDGRPRLALTDTGYFEGSADSVRSLYVHLVDSATGKLLDASSAPEVPINFTWAMSDGTGTGSAAATLADNDYVNVKGSVTDSVRANRWIDTIKVTTKGDLRYEPDENFLVTLIPGLNAYPTAGNTVSHDTLRNDDNQPIVQIVADTSRMKTIGLNKGFLEGAAGQNPPDTAYFIVKLITQADGKSLLPLKDLPAGGMSYFWTTIDGTAIGRISGKSTADTDYVALSGSRKIIGNNVDTIKVPIIGDNKYENNETFSVQLSKLTNYSDTSSRNILSATATILNDDSLPRLQVTVDSGKEFSEGESGDRHSATFTVTLTDTAGKPLPIVDAPEVPVIFSWKTLDGTAKTTNVGLADTDYVSVPNDTDTIPVGSLTKKLSVFIKGDIIEEVNESFSVVLSPVANAASTGTLKADAIIIDDDVPPELTLSGVSKNECNSGVTTFPFIASLSRASSLPVIIGWKTVDSTALLADNDYQKVPVSGTLKYDTILPGRTLDTLAVYVNGDIKLEPDEYFYIKVDSLKGASFLQVSGKSKDTAVGTILNDDADPFIRVSNANPFYEGTPPAVTSSNPNVLKFVVTLVDSTGAPYTRDSSGTKVSRLGENLVFNWSTVDSSGTFGASSSTDTDFVRVTNHTDTIKAGRLVDTLVVKIVPDAKYELPESFRVQITGFPSSLTGVVVPDTSTAGKSILTAAGTIRNDDSLPILTVRDTFVTEPASASSPDSFLVFTYRLVDSTGKAVASGLPVTFSSWTQGGTATPDNSSTKYDYTPVNHVVTIPAGTSIAYDTVRVHGDSIYEGTENLWLKLSIGASGYAKLARDSALGTIYDQDKPPYLHVTGDTVSEGGTLTFTISLVDSSGKAAASGLPVVFNWRTAAAGTDYGYAVAGLDYDSSSGIDTIKLGVGSVTITVKSLTDNIANEGLESFKLLLSNAVNAGIKDTGLGYILDATVKPVISIDSVIDTEGKIFTFRVHLDKVSAQPIYLTYGTTVDGIASSPIDKRARSGGTDPDYVAQTGVTFTLPAGITDTVIKITTVNNNVDDRDTLYFKVLLAASSSASKADTSFDFKDSIGLGGILDNDLPPAISINDTSVQEPAKAGDSTYAVFTVKLSSKSSQAVTVYWHTVDGTASSMATSTASADYKAASGTIVIPAGALDTTISIVVYGDSLYEGSETFTVRLDSSSKASISDSSGIGTIIDNDDPPTIYVKNAAITEPANGSTVVLKFPVYLNRRSAKDVTFAWSTHDSTATHEAISTTHNLDYDSTGGSVTIKAGDTTATLSVTVRGDAVSNENDEYFKMVLTSIVNALKGDTLAIGTIHDNNGMPFLSIDSQTVVEKDTTIFFHLKLDFASAKNIHVGYSTVGITAIGNVDYEDTSGTVNFAPGDTTATIGVRIIDDKIKEDAETFRVWLSSCDSANIVDSTGIGTIIDNDLAPSISISNDTVTEPATAGDSTTATFTVRLSARSGLPVTVRWTTVDSTAQSSSSPVDYRADGGTLTFQPSDTVKTISITVYGDSLYEGTEYFKVRLYDTSGASLSADSVGIGTILDNDSAPVLSITDPTVREGETAIFTVTLNRTSALPVIFSYRTVQVGTAYGDATAGKDYDTISGVDTIAAGELSTTISVHTLTDTISAEGAEIFQVRLTIDSVNHLISAIGDTIGVGTILDTTSLPKLSIDSLHSILEKDTFVSFTVTLSGGLSAVPVVISYKTVDGTAKAGVRYEAASGAVTIPAGATSVTIPIHILNDSIRESQPQTFMVQLLDAGFAVIEQPIGLGTIYDDGDFPHVAVDNSDTVSEGDPALFPVTLRGLTSDTVKVYWHTVDGQMSWNQGTPADSGSDYTASSGVVVIPPGQSQFSISTPTLLDSVWEPTEVFAIHIDSVVGADTAKGKSLLRPADSLALAWIADKGGILTVRFLSSDTSVREDSALSVPVVVGLSRPASVAIKVLIPHVSVTTTKGAAYTSSLDSTGDTLTFPAGSTTATFYVHVKDDSIDEYDETVEWDLQPIYPVAIGSKSNYRLSIFDDDSAPVISFARDTQHVREGDSVRILVHLNRPSGKDIQAWYRTSGTATPGVDDDLRPDAHEEFFIKAGDTTASVLVHTVDDSIYEGTESMVFTIDSTVNATKGTPSVDSVFILDNDSVPVVSFVVADTKVKEDVGTVTLRIHLDHPAAAPIHVWIKAHAMPLDTVKGIYPATLLSNGNKNDTLVSTSNQADVALNGDSTYVVVIPSLDTSVTFSFKVLDDGRVEPTETFRLGITSEEANPKDPDSLQVHILDNDKLPAVKITSPADSAHLGKKDLDGDGKVPVTWTVNGTVQTPYDTLLPEGKSVIRKSYTDIWGNVGTDTITVWLDTTPPIVKVDSISKDGGKTWIAVDTPWVNVPGIIVKWHSIDDGVITWHQDSTKLTDTLNTISRCFEDAVGNKGCSSGTVGLDTTAPKVWITTPPNGSQWPLGCVGVTYYVQDMGTTTRHDTTYCSDVLGPQTITTPTYIDRAGNTAKGTTNIVMVPNTPSSAKYIDSDGDGRIDEVIVQFPAKVVGNLPSFEISYGTPGANTISSSSVSYGSSSQAGNYYVVKGDTLRNTSGTAVKVVEGRPVVGSDGQQLVDSTGKPVFASTGTPLLDALGKQVCDTNGIPLWVAASSSAVDSSVLVVKLVPQFPYGWTSSTVTNLGVIKGTNAAVVNGQTIKQSWADTFDIKDGVAPVIEKSEIHRTESYSGKDTLWIYPSEPLTFKSKDGSGIFQVSLDSGKTWIDVKVSSISSTGALQIILDLGSGVKPGVMVRFGDSVSDAAGNVVNHNTDTTKVVVQGPSRPDLIDVTQPSGVIQVNPSTGNSAQKGGFAFVASTGDTSTASMKTYQPGQGYSNAPQDLCPDYNQCSVTSLYINKPSSVQMYIYDQIGTYIASTRFAITEQDIKTIQKDKLDRTQLKVLWNLRDTKGEQVVSGIYLIRFVVRNDNFTTVNGSLENHVIKIGVKIN